MKSQGILLSLMCGNPEAIICVYITGEIWTISDALYVSNFKLNYLNHHMWHTIKIVERGPHWPSG